MRTSGPRSTVVRTFRHNGALTRGRCARHTVQHYAAIANTFLRFGHGTTFALRSAGGWCACSGAGAVLWLGVPSCSSSSWRQATSWTTAFDDEDFAASSFVHDRALQNAGRRGPCVVASMPHLSCA